MCRPLASVQALARPDYFPTRLAASHTLTLMSVLYGRVIVGEADAAVKRAAMCSAVKR
jgi:hypothetical protein